MSTEMQPEDDYIEDDEIVDEDVEQESEDQDTDSESSTDSGGNHEKQITFSEDQQRKVDEVVGKKVFQLREKERELEAAKKQLENLQSKIPEAKRPDVPTLPDPFALSDEEYKRQQQERDQALLQQAQYDAQQQAREQQRLYAMQEQQARQHEVQVKRVEAYAERAKKVGVTSDELQVAGSTVAQFGIDQQLVDFILEDEQGPLITKYLSQNLQELSSLTEMSPAMAAAKIATDIRTKAVSLKKKVNAAPDPLETPHGAGVAPKPRGPKGASFE